MSNSAIDVSIIIPSWNSIEITRECLKSLTNNSHQCSTEIIVVDNGSGDGSAEMINTEFPEVILIRNTKNELYSKACNQGAAAATGKYICYLNSDTEVLPDALRHLIDFLEINNLYDAVAPKLIEKNGTVQKTCRRFPGILEVVIDQFSLSRFKVVENYRGWVQMVEFDHLSSRDVEQPPGACLVMRRSDINAYGGFDEALPLFYSDVDLCLRIRRRGQRIRYLSEAVIVHIGSHSIVKHPLWRAEFMRSQVHYYRKNFGLSAAVFARCTILLSALIVSLRTALGKRSLIEKREIISQISKATRIAIGL